MALQSSSTVPPVVLALATVDEPPPAPLAPVVLVGPPTLPAPPAPDTLLLVEFAPKPPGPNPPGPMPPVVAVPLVELVTPWLPTVEAVVAVALVAVELVAVEPGDVVDVLPMLAEPAVVVLVGPGPPNPPVTLVWLVVSSKPGGDSPAGSEHPALSRMSSECILGKGARWRPSREREKLDRWRAWTRRQDEVFTTPSVFRTAPGVGPKRRNLAGSVTAKLCSVGAVWDYLVALAMPVTLFVSWTIRTSYAAS